jgi:GNAT superfamily N-acetyltransferase
MHYLHQSVNFAISHPDLSCHISYMKIEILTHSGLHLINTISSAFTVDSKLKLKLSENKFSYEIEAMPPYEKNYEYEDMDYSVYIGNKDKIVFFAFENEKLAGQIIVFKYWNRYAYINDIRIQKEFRGKGIGKALMQKSIEWAKEHDCVGVEAETQDINVKACLFYEKLGFNLGGVNLFRYKFSEKEKNEIALNWYLLF